MGGITERIGDVERIDARNADNITRFSAIGLNASVVPGMSSPYPFGDLELFYEGQPMTRVSAIS